jgi:hypothetical protein
MTTDLQTSPFATLKAIGKALVMLDELRESFNQQWFDALVAENLITAGERERALENMSSENVLASPAAALAWMSMSDVISSARMDEIRAAGGSAGRAAIMAEADGIVSQTNAAVKSAVLGAIFPGPRWLWIAAPLLVVGFLVWSAVKPSSAPSCTDSDISRTINSMLFKAGIDSRVNDAMRGKTDTRAMVPTVHAIREVGYATGPGIRGCVGTIKVDDSELPYAFTIAPSGSEKGEYAVIGAEPAIVQARFGHLDADGKFLNQAEPVGRAEVERAFRAGIAGVGMARAPYGRTPARTGNLSTMAPERTREIAEIEPMAPCRVVKSGTVYSCRLLVERNDALLAAIGASSTTLLDGEFTFERDSAAGAWRMSEAFADEYMKAVVAARVKAVTR